MKTNEGGIPLLGPISLIFQTFFTLFCLFCNLNFFSIFFGGTLPLLCGEILFLCQKMCYNEEIFFSTVGKDCMYTVHV